MDDLFGELGRAWQSVPYLSLALIVSAWMVGVFGVSLALEDCGESAEGVRKLARRREFLKTHTV